MLEQISLDLIRSREMPAGFNWIAVLKDLKAGSPVTDMDMEKLQLMAGNWPTCACGQLCKFLPRTNGGAPKDGLLTGLGVVFSAAIDCKDWARALKTFAEIEKRTEELLLRQLGPEPESAHSQ